MGCVSHFNTNPLYIKLDTEREREIPPNPIPSYYRQQKYTPPPSVCSFTITKLKEVFVLGTTISTWITRTGQFTTRNKHAVELTPCHVHARSKNTSKLLIRVHIARTASINRHNQRVTVTLLWLSLRPAPRGRAGREEWTFNPI